MNVPILKINKSKGGTSSSAYQSYDFIYGMSFLNSEDGWAVGSPSLLLHFDGQEWERQSVDEKFSSLRSISFMDENNGISAGYGGTILLFENKLWRKDNSGISKKLNGTAVWDSTYYAVGESGTIISRTTKLHNNTTVYSNKSGGETGLQVYPNPCNDFLKFILPEDLNENPLQIIMTGIPGQIILEIKYNTSVPGGEYTLVTKPINNGFYLLNVITGDKHFINKILIKH